MVRERRETTSGLPPFVVAGSRGTPTRDDSGATTRTKDRVADPDNITHAICNVSQRPLKYGGTSDVHQGMWRRETGDTLVALKVFRVADNPGEDKVRHRLRREISVWKRLSHPNLHELCGLYEGLGPLPALVSVWYECGDIKQYLNTRRDDPDLDGIKLNLILGSASGLDYLHRNEIVHRDIKGANVLVSNDGTARLSDFGFSVILADHSLSLTQSTTAHGTFRWMAPELHLDDDIHYSYASDIWAFGCLVIEIFSGERPYHTLKRDVQVIAAVTKGDPPPIPPFFPDFLSSIVHRCCIYNATERPSSSDIMSDFQPKAVLAKISRIITGAHPMDDFVRSLLRLIDGSLTAAAAHYPLLYKGLAALPNAELAAITIRRLAVWNAVVAVPDRPYELEEQVLQWCLDLIGEGTVSLQAIRRLTSGRAASEEGEAKNTVFERSALRPLARLLAAIDPTYGERFMTRFASPALGPLVKLDSYAACIAWLPDSTGVVVGCSDHTVRLLHGITVGEDVAVQLLVQHAGEVNGIAVSPDGRFLASCSDDKLIAVRDMAANLTLSFALAGHTSWVVAVSFSPCSMFVVSGSDDCTIRIWSIATLTRTTVIGPLHGNLGRNHSPILCVAYSPDGRRIVSGSDDTTVQVWDACTGSLIVTLGGHRDIVRSVAFHPDSVHVVSGSYDYTASIWDVTTLCVGHPLRGHTDWVRSVAYSPDGRRIISTSDDNTICIWNAETGRLLSRMRGHERAVWSAVFSPDGTRIASVSLDATVRIWDATEEWRRYDV
ncbi:WD40 repeat-like protein [Exidia glandulosa HHB12029]|uniref:WD40 repeat-containing protein SMU1 n=1 Tax=Exidia glandulosa HHB12029 TaxID=1314781 RepID=A0A165K1Q1_EXIGL|nr:WD40 repeat-like protein [Exidia glandulosa HHB12029]